MGSNGPLVQPEDGHEIVVVVTGFGPFKAQYPINPSWSIASSLPPFIPLFPHAHPTTSTDHPSPLIRILVHPSPVRVSYAAVRALVPKLWDGVARIDFMIHVGMAGGRDFYSVERRGHRDGYATADVDGVVLGDEQRREGWVWEGCPKELETEVDLDDVWRRWWRALPDVDVRPSEDAGRYLCDFIYYSSLAELWKQGEERRVVFLHVPVESDDEAIARGREVVIELIRALVQSRKMVRLAQR